MEINTELLRCLVDGHEMEFERMSCHLNHINLLCYGTSEDCLVANCACVQEFQGPRISSAELRLKREQWGVGIFSSMAMMWGPWGWRGIAGSSNGTCISHAIRQNC